MVHLFEDCNLCAIHARRVTISARPHPPCAPFGVVRPWGGEWGAGGLGSAGAGDRTFPQLHTTTDAKITPLLPHPLPTRAVPKDLQLARRIRGPVAGVSSF